MIRTEAVSEIPIRLDSFQRRFCLIMPPQVDAAEARMQEARGQREQAAAAGAAQLQEVCT